MINCQWNDEELGHHLNAEAKKYIADNNIQLYTINAIDKAIEIGMGKDVYKRQPHNLSEVIDGCVAYIENPDIDLPGLMEHIKGPDFPTAGIIMGRSGIRAAYATGRGKITLRGRATIEETKNGRTRCV